MSDVALPAYLAAAVAGRYALRRELGRGGMATVYLAADLKHHREVALKVLRPDLAASLGSERFLKEIEIAARLTHPHVLALHDSGEAGGFLYYVMPYIEGGSLRQVLEKERRLDLERALAIAGPVADALGYAHRMGVLHRDIKPENILFSQGHPVVADFGIAKAVSTAGGANLTRTGFPLGTPGYMSPEQAAGLTDLDERTDVYGLAVVVYEMLVGETPGGWPSEESVRTGRLLEAPSSHRLALARVPPCVESALARAFAIRGAQRTPTPLRLVAELRGAGVAAAAEGGASAGPAGAGAAAGERLAAGALPLARDTAPAGASAAVLPAAPVRAEPAQAPGPAMPAPGGDGRREEPRRRYDDGEVREIVRRAAELDASHPTASGAMTIGSIERLAGEALIPADAVREAALAVDVRRSAPVPVLADGTPDTPGQRTARRWLGGPTYLLFEREVAGEVPDVEFPGLVELIRSEMGQVGQVGQLGRSFSWASTRGQAGGRDVQVLVSVRGGQTRLQVRENLGNTLGGVFGGLMGGLGGGGFGPIMGILGGALHAPAAAFIAGPLWLVAVFSGSRSAYFYSVRRKRRQLGELADRLAALAGQVAK